jgi:hypothetical protein
MKVTDGLFGTGQISVTSKWWAFEWRSSSFFVVKNGV